jgi:hypothetical protein
MVLTSWLRALKRDLVDYDPDVDIKREKTVYWCDSCIPIEVKACWLDVVA